MIQQKSHKTSPIRPPSAMERLQALEARHNVLVARTQKAFQAMEQRLVAAERALSAVIDIVGAEEVHHRIQDQYNKEQEERADNNEAAVNDAVEKGQLKEVDAVDGDDTLIVSQEKNEKGEVLYPTRNFISLGGFSNQPDVKALLANSKKGDEVEMPNKHTIIVIRCYKPVPPSEQPTPNPEDAVMDAAPQEETQEPTSAPNAEV